MKKISWGKRKVKNRISILIIVIAALMSLSGPTLAGNKATIMVSATVVASVSQSLIHQVSRFNVTEEDIRRGFIEIPSATVLQIKTNDRRGYVLLFEGGNELFKEVLVTDKGRTVVLSPFGGLIHQPYSGSNIEVKDLSYKFFLRDNIQPGSYSWPFRVKASIL
jgi:hypothetical protein